MSSPGLNELREGKQEFDRFYQRLWRKQLSRRRVIRIGALASMLGINGAVQALIAACGGGEEAGTGATASPSSGGAGSPTTSAAITGDWDTTDTPPYKNGLPDEVAKVPEQWKQYPWMYKFGHWRYNWDVPVTRGGSVIVAWASASDFNTMVSGIQAQPSNNKLYNAALREGVNPLTASIEPELARSEEHNADFTTWIVKIPERVKFHNLPPVNGRELTAEDVVFSLERYRDTSVFKAALRHVDKITAVDRQTIRFDLKQPQLNFPNTLATPHFVIFAPEHFENQDRFKAQAIGTGPFILKFNEYQNRTEFIRNPDYWELPPYKPEKYGKQPLPFADAFTRQYYANQVQAKEAYITGQIDNWDPSCSVDPTIWKELMERTPDSLFITGVHWSCCPLGVSFQWRNPLFQDIRVRKAISMAVNREQVWRDGMFRAGAPGAGPVPFDLMGLELPVPLSEFGPNAQYNPEQAKQLLREAGHNPPLKMQFYRTAQSTASLQGAIDTVLFNWRESGVVDAEDIIREPLVFTQDRLNRSFPDLYWGGYFSLGYSVDTMLGPYFLTDSPANISSLSDPVLDELFEKQSVATSPDEANRLARQINERVVENVDNIWVGWWPSADITRGWLHGMVVSTHNCFNGIGQGNYKYFWIDETAPDGRGGKPIST